MSTSANFDASYYLTNNADVVVAISQGSFSSALDHYNNFGGRELRQPNANFDPNYYAINNPDVLNAVSSGAFPSVFAHYQEFGEIENRAPSTSFAGFDATAYLAANADVAAAVTAGTIASALDHFISFGQAEARTGSGVTAPTNPGTTLTLTDSVDSLTGGTGDDAFNATDGTLGAGDVLAGGTGADSLNYTSTGTTAVTETGFTTSSVETLNVTAVNAGGTTVSVNAMAGLTNVNSNSSTNALTVNLLGSIVDVGVSNATAGNIDIDYTAAAVAGTTTSQTLTLSNALSTAGGAFGTIQLGNGAGTGIETLNIVSNTSANNVTSITSGATTVNISGSAALTVGAALAGATTISASDATGAVTVIADSAGTANDVAITGGTGNDSADFSAGFEASDSFTGGDGTDTVILTQATASGTLGGTLTSVEQLSVSDAGTGTIDMDSFTGVTKVIFDDGITANGTATVSDIAATGLEIEVDVANAVAADATLVVTQKTDGAADDITITLDAIAAGEGLASLSVANAETVTISADDDTTDGTGTMTIASLTASDATSISISGDSALTITNTVDPTTAVLATLDAGSMTDALTLSGTNFASGGATVTLGSGNDVINVATMSGADTIILTNGGNDRLVYTALAQSDVDEDTITGFTSGSDDIDLRTFTGRNVTTATQFGGVGTDLATAQSLLGGTNAVVAVFQADANRLWLDVDANGTLNSADFRVTLTDVATITAADLNLATTGNTITLNAAAAVLSTTLSTNASAATTTAGDSISSSAANIVGSTIDGGEGNDTLTISSGTAAVDLGAAAGTIANVETVVTATGVTNLSLLAADIGALTGSISTITGLAGTAQTLTVDATEDFSAITIRGFTTLSDTAGGTLVWTLDNDNLTDITTITMNGGGADTIALTDGTYDFSAITTTFGTGASVLDLDTQGNLAKTVTADAADLNNVGTITGETTAGIITTLNLNDADDISGVTVTDVDVLTIGGTNQSATVSRADFVAGNFTTVTGSGDSNLVIGDAGTLGLTNTTVSGFDVITFDTVGANAITFDVASISGTVAATAAAGTDLIFSETGDYTNIVIAAGDTDSVVVNDGLTVSLDATSFDGDTVALDGDSAATAAITLVQSTTGALVLSGVSEGGSQAVASVTVNGTSGADTITGLTAVTAASTHVINGGDGNDIIIAGGDYGATLTTGSMTFTGGNGVDNFRLIDATNVATTGAFDTDKAIVISDLQADGGEQVQISTALTSTNAIGSLATGGIADLQNFGVLLVTGAAVNDFTNEAQAIAAIGGGLTADGDGNDDSVFVIQNSGGTQAGVYIFDDAAGALNGAAAATSDLQLAAIVNITGTLDLTDISLF